MAVRPAPSPAVPTVRLSVGQKTAYGFGDLVIAIRMSSFQFYLLPFYTDVALVAPWLAGMGKMVGLLWDGLNDPVVGHLSDRTRTRLGRRRPFLLGAALPVGLAFAALWSPPRGLGPAGAFVYLVAVLLVLDTVFSLYATPYLALGAELSEDYHERTQLAAARAFFHLIGLLIGVMVPAALLARHPAAPVAGFRLMGWSLGALVAGVALVTGAVLREPRVPSERTEPFSWRALTTGLFTTLENPAFRVLIAAFVFILLAAGLYQTLLPYAFRYWLRRPELVTRVPVIHTVAAVVSLPLWTRLARRLGKDGAMRLCMLWAAGALGLSPLALGPAMSDARLIAFVVLAGLGNGGWMVLPVALTADVVDYDELSTARRREGTYFGIWILVMKWAGAIASGVVGIALQHLGYVPNQMQSPTVVRGIELLYGPVPAGLMLVALVLFLRFPLTRERHAALREALSKRREI